MWHWVGTLVVTINWIQYVYTKLITGYSPWHICVHYDVHFVNIITYSIRSFLYENGIFILCNSFYHDISIFKQTFKLMLLNQELKKIRWCNVQLENYIRKTISATIIVWRNTMTSLTAPISTHGATSESAAISTVT